MHPFLRPPTMAAFTAALLIITTTILTTTTAHNITRILAKHPELSTFNHYLSLTHLASQIDSRTTITVCAVDNAAMEDLLSKHLPINTIKNILSLHVLLDYFGAKKLHQITNGTALAATMYQATGTAPGSSGFVNITDLRGGKVGFGAENNDGALTASYVKSVEEIPYNISVIQISSVLPSVAAEAPTPAPSQQNLTVIMSKHGCKIFAETLSTFHEAYNTFTDAIDGGLSVFCPADDAFKAFLPKFKNLTMSGKVDLLEFHGVPIYNSIPMLKSNNGLMHTLATEGASNYDFTVQNDGEEITLKTKRVTAKIIDTIIDDQPLAIYTISKVLLPQELFKGEAPSPSPSPAPEPAAADAPEPPKKGKKKKKKVADAPADDDSDAPADSPGDDAADDNADDSDGAVRLNGIVVGEMARPFSFIADLNEKKDFWKLAVKVVDRWNVVKDGREHSEMVIVDAKGNDIQVLIPTGYKSQYEKVIEENCTYTLSNFLVQVNDFVFKASEHKFKLIWTGGTTADQVNVHQIPDVALKFKPLAEIAAGRWRSDLLIHVIGYVHEVGYCQMTEGTSKKLQVNFWLKDLSDVPVNCTLWEEYAAKFIKFSNERKEAGPIVVMLKYAKVKEEGKYPLSVTNTYGVTKLFINDNIAEIKKFKESLPKQDQLESQSQLMCTQTFNGSQFDTEDEILGNNLIMPLSEIIQLDQITYCVTAVRVEKVNSTRFGWYYLVCCKCNKVAKGDKPPYTCDSGHNTETEIVRYKLELDVSYEDTKSTFVMWDREVSQLLGISAAQLRLNMIEAGITNRLEYPTLIDSIGQKSMVFKVKWQPRWKTGSVVSYKEGDAICELIKSKYPNAPVLALPAESTEVVDKPSDNFSLTDDSTMSLPGLSGTAENDVETLSQLTPMSEKSTTPGIKQKSSDQITPAKPVSVPALPLPDAFDDITPAKHSSSKRVKLIKTEKK